MKKSTKIFIIVDTILILLFGLLFVPPIKDKVVDILSQSETTKKIVYILYGKEKLLAKQEEQIKLVTSESLENVVISNTKVTKVTCLATGDALIHSSVYNSHKTSTGYDFSDIFDDTKDIIEQYDLAYYNQETILGGAELGLSNYPQFNSPYEVGDAFVNVGFNLIGLANNHTLDGMYRYGLQAVYNSRDYWDKQQEEKGVIATGSWRSWENREEVVIGEIKGVTYALLSYTTLTNLLFPPEGKEYSTNIYSQEKAKADIEKYRDKVDVLMVAMHWGVDYMFTPNTQEKQIAQYLSSLGVDIIFGGHAHYIQPIAMVGDTLVFYGLGNFVSSQRESSRPYSLTGVLTNFTIVKTEIDGNVKITFENVEAELVYTRKDMKYRVVPYARLDKHTDRNDEAMYQKYKDVLTMYWNEVYVK